MDDDHVSESTCRRPLRNGFLPAVARHRRLHTVAGEGARASSIESGRDHDHDRSASRSRREHRATIATRGRPPSSLKLLEASDAARARSPRPPAATIAAAGTSSRGRYPSTSSSIFSASSSLQFFEKVSSETRIWRALVSMRFSPADRPFSLSRW